MAARLARAPVPWRELSVGLVVVAMIAGFTWIMWARQPTLGPRTHTTARILKVTLGSATKYAPARASIEVEFADGRRELVSALYGQAHRCNAGDSVVVTRTPTNVGQPELTIDTGTCG